MIIINLYFREFMGYKYFIKFVIIYIFLVKYVFFGEKIILNEFLKKGLWVILFIEVEMFNFDLSYK